MSHNYFKPSEYSIKDAILDNMKYGDIHIGNNYIMKDHGDYVEVNVDADNKKGHISFNVYYDDKGNVTKVLAHKNN